MEELKKPAAQEPEKLWNLPFIMLFLLGTVTQCASQMVMPLVTDYATSIGASLTLAATIASLMSISALILRPVSGLVSDRMNRKVIIMVTNGIIAACIFLLGRTTSIPALVVIRLVHGFAFAFSGVALMAFNALFIPKTRLGEGMGWLALGTVLSQAMGPNIGIFLVDNFGYDVCFTVASGICVVGIGVVALIPYKWERPAATGKKLNVNDLVSVRLLPYAALLALFSCGNGLASSLLVVMGKAKGIANIGLFFTAYSIATVVTRPFMGKLLDRRGLNIIMYPAIIAASLCYVLLGSATTLWVVIIAGICKAFGAGTATPSVQGTCLKQLGKEKAGVVSSTCYIGQDIGNALAPIIGGAVAEQYGYTVLCHGYAALMLVGGVVLYYIKSAYDKRVYGWKN